MPAAIDLAGRQLNHWRVIELIHGSRPRRWLCECKCGAIVSVGGQSLREGTSAQCFGCARKQVGAIKAARPLDKRFWRFVEPEPNSGCWLWSGSCDSKGYGQLRLGHGRLVYATHISLELVGRQLSTGLFALHKCDNPPCVNPDHLFAGTQKDNSQDAKRKGRLNLSGLALGRQPTGYVPRPHLRKFTPEQIIEIRSSKRGAASTARHFGVFKCAITNIRRRKTYRDII